MTVYTQCAMLTAALCALVTAAAAAAPVAATPAQAAAGGIITIDDHDVFPESITSTAAGDLIIGSLTKGAIYRAKAGAATAGLWLDPTQTGLVVVLGVFADDLSNTLYVCSVAPRKGPPRPELSALRAFDLTTGKDKGKYPLPNPESAVCNDIAVDGNGTAYVTDTKGGRILRLSPGGGALEIWAADERLTGADGIAVGDGVLYVNTVTTNRLFSIAVNVNGTAGEVLELQPSLPLSRPDGMRTLGGNRFLMTESAPVTGRITAVTVTGTQADIQVLKVDPGVTAITRIGNTVWVNNGKFDYLPDAALHGQSPEPFVEYAIPLPAVAHSTVPTGTPPGVTPLQPRNSSGFPPPRTVPGQPIESRPPELATDKPAFPGQTRAPYRPTPPYAVTVITDKLKSPWGFVFLPDRSMLVTERSGAMLIVNADGTVSAPLTGVPAVDFRGQVGLLDVALDGHFAANHRIFFSYMEPNGGDSAIVMARATLDVAAGALNEVEVIFRAKPALPKALMYNAGGRIAVARDGSLFLTVGDRSKSPPWDMAQQLDTDLGKIVHLTPDGAPAPGNPYVGQHGALPEIWSIGHRSEEGLAFDSQGRLWETEHGPRGGDELNLLREGRNYGWPVVTHAIDYPGELIDNGLTEKAGMEQPRYYWDPVIAPSGLAFYQGSLFPQWKDSALVGALRGTMLDRLTIKGDRVIDEEPLLVDLHSRIRDVRIGPEGAVYVLTDASSLLKLTPR